MSVMVGFSRQCWAFHNDGTRCQLSADHDGDHAVERTWGDDECAIPTVPMQRQPVPAPVATPLVEVTLKCVACGHQHKGGPCKCGCHEFIG
jgi:hypothetical protein